MAGPVSPPTRIPSRESTSNPPLGSLASAEWHLKQCSTRTGRIFFSKNSMPWAWLSGGAAEADDAIRPNDTAHHAITTGRRLPPRNPRQDFISAASSASQTRRDDNIPQIVPELGV